jgi:hypothetical protein
MIVIGVAPGLKALSYAVINASGEVPWVIDKDVLLGPRLKEGVVDFVKKAYVHYLILDVIFERELETFGKSPRPTAVLAIGPACNPKEHPEHVQAVRTMLKTLAGKSRIPVVMVDDAGLARALSPAPRESWLRVANARLQEKLDTDDRKIVLAVVVGLAGAALYRKELT